MANWRDIKRNARAAIHGTFKVPAVYLTHTAGVPVACSIRVHSKVTTGEGESPWQSAPGYLEIDPYVIFSTAEVPAPLGRAYVIVSDDEIYRVGTAEPQREGFVKATVTALTAIECSTLVGEIDTSAPVWLGILA